MNRTTSSLLAAAVFASAVPGAAQTPAAAPEPPAITIGGFISSTFFLQDPPFQVGNGQNAVFAGFTTENVAGARTSDRFILGGDARNTRITANMRGPVILNGWQSSGQIEVDFFGPFNGGAFGDEQQGLRMRLGYINFQKGGTAVRIGQWYSPSLAQVAVSPTHLAFPLGFGGSGAVGWRQPGLYLFQSLTDPRTGPHVQLNLAAFRGSDADNLINNPNTPSRGEASAIPQLEAKVTVSNQIGAPGPQWNAYVVGHVDRKDVSGAFVEGIPGTPDDLTGRMLSAGGKYVTGPYTLAATGYVGTAVGQLFGAITQFGDISSVGAWVQGGYVFNPEWSVWVYGGFDNPDDNDVRDSGNTRLSNLIFSPHVRYNAGPIQFGLEYYGARTTWQLPIRDADGAITSYRDSFDAVGNQLSFSVFFPF